MSVVVLLALLAPDPVIARPCSSAEVAALTAPAAADTPAVHLTCFATLPPGVAVRRHIVFEGAEASGAGLDCSGGSVGVPGRPSTTRDPTVAVWSRREGRGWSIPRDVRITRCTIHGNLRVWGLGRSDIDGLRASSRTPGHTAATQAAAPTGLMLDNVAFVATGSIPLYVGPGVTGLRMTGGGFRGQSVSTAIYLDAESAGAVIRNVAFAIRTAREQIAVDGSARNRIEDNRFQLNGRGGVFLYRNCGEDGVIRHQTPSDNVISGNRFEGAAWLTPRPIVVGSREGRRRYCGDDAGYPFGSSADDRDRATGNIVSGNTTGLRWLPSTVQAGRGAVRAP
ncbi:right-handed parallel beta-helix repeat-containing protein [Brevundimonas sp.]|uniref:right-handed parallel beta-helix repeat-containing protein n=1 Tax=Brevundimonas sp. TaxID=1871086 RepID=UPI0026390F40|nr:right-handed parallel beta-helix repeat-containing protein [Brevundimonas sp.]